MPSYTVDARPRVRKALRQLDPAIRQNVLVKMRTLASDPRPSGVEALHGHRPWLRLRVGDYRIIYMVDDEARLVTVLTVGHRREVYRNLGL